MVEVLEVCLEAPITTWSIVHKYAGSIGSHIGALLYDIPLFAYRNRQATTKHSPLFGYCVLQRTDHRAWYSKIGSHSAGLVVMELFID